MTADPPPVQPSEPAPDRERAVLVYCEQRVLLDRRDYLDWRAIQAAYPDYLTSLGPWERGSIVEFLEESFGVEDRTWPFSRTAIAQFFSGSGPTLESNSE